MLLSDTYAATKVVIFFISLAICTTAAHFTASKNQRQMSNYYARIGRQKPQTHHPSTHQRRVTPQAHAVAIQPNPQKNTTNSTK